MNTSVPCVRPAVENVYLKQDPLLVLHSVGICVPVTIRKVRMMKVALERMQLHLIPLLR
jgi:hypothetical protein